MIDKNKLSQWTGTGYLPMKDIEVKCGFSMVKAII